MSDHVGEKTIVRLRCSSPRSTFEVETKGADLFSQSHGEGRTTQTSSAPLSCKPVPVTSGAKCQTNLLLLREYSLIRKLDFTRFLFSL